MSPHAVASVPPMQGVYFPPPLVIPFVSLGLPPQAEEIFQTAARGLTGTKEGRYRGQVTSSLAFRVGRTMRFGKAAKSPLWRRTWGTIQDRFFAGASFFRTDGEVRPVEVRLNPDKPFADGDTAKIVSFKRGGEWMDAKVSVRMDGIDTLESNQSEKLRSQVEFVAKYLAEEHGVQKRDLAALADLVEARIVYLGKIAGAATHGFGQRFADIGIRLGPAYMRVTKKDAPELCDSLDMYDKYGRIIGRILAGKENQGEDLLAGFMEAVLPNVMRDAEAEYLNAYRLKLSGYRKRMKRWEKEKPALYMILGGETVPVPTQIFSAEKCRTMARCWTEFCVQEPRARNDLQTMLVFLGLAPVYQKYRGHLTGIDLSAELFALGAMPDIPDGHGLTRDTMYIFLRPSAAQNDPYDSPVYRRYGVEMSSGIRDIAELNPPDCTERACAGKSG